MGQQPVQQEVKTFVVAMAPKKDVVINRIFLYKKEKYIKRIRKKDTKALKR